MCQVGASLFEAVREAVGVWYNVSKQEQCFRLGQTSSAPRRRMPRCAALYDVVRRCTTLHGVCHACATLHAAVCTGAAAVAAPAAEGGTERAAEVARSRGPVREPAGVCTADAIPGGNAAGSIIDVSIHPSIYIIVSISPPRRLGRAVLQRESESGMRPHSAVSSAESHQRASKE